MTSSVDADIEKRLLLDDDDHSAPHHNTNDQRWEYATNQYTQLEVDDSETTPLSRPIGTATDETDIEATEEPKSYRLPTEGGSIFASFLNMANSIIGAGIIGLPFSFKEAGFWMGILLLLLLTLVVDWTVRLLMYNGKLAGRATYQDLLAFSFGRGGLIAISIFQFAFAFGGMCAYCVILGDTIPHVIKSLVPSIDQLPIVWIFANRRLCITFFTVFVSYPLSLYRDISKLAKTSGLALIAIGVIIVSVVIEGPKMPAEIRGSPDQRFTFANDEIFQAIAVISFAFVCHHNSFLIFGSLKQPSLNRFAMVTHWSMVIAFVTCFILAVSGYVVFTDKTAGNILNNFPADNVLINIARLAFGLNMFTTIPLEAFVCREVLETFFWPNAEFQWSRHIALTTILVLISLTVSLLTCNLGIVLELTGGFSATALAYVLPPLCYLKLATGSLFQWSKIPHWACLVFGLSIMVISTFYSLQKVFTPQYDLPLDGGNSSSSGGAATCDL
ncbi:amino acid transporter [Lichtheimia corymbifera JMRC:FSU:9682]|uniref:Amino acid transporter n=1 Tax=Lichtheimia corymbifera JMRC:FSU:9682 TaxID=1263082 RepID=A0A068S400_9FUNG|nr:amino acid transporter [Lichtheimia corymbifera JMRC:FSU:9682]